MRVKDLMRPTSEVIHLDQSLLDAAIRMRRYRLPALAVVDGDEIVGLLTPEDVAAKVGSRENDLSEAAVRDHMSAEIGFCGPDESIETARAVMREGGHGELLVVDSEGRFCGLIAAEAIGTTGEENAEAVPEHLVKTPGRRRGSQLHQPGNYSVRPRIKD